MTSSKKGVMFFGVEHDKAPCVASPRVVTNMAERFESDELDRIDD